MLQNKVDGRKILKLFKMCILESTSGNKFGFLKDEEV